MCVLEHSVVRDGLFKGLFGEEVIIDPIRLAVTGRPRCGRHGKRNARIPSNEAFGKCGFACAGWRGQNDQEAATVFHILLHILNLFTHLVDHRLEIKPDAGQRTHLRFGAQRVGFSIELLR